MPELLNCCPAWNQNRLVAQNRSMAMVLDGFPVRPGHCLVIPKRHVVRLADLNGIEVLDLHRMIDEMSTGADMMIAINDGPAAGRTVHHLHVHLIPVAAADPLPAGGIRGLFIQPGQDPYLNRSPDAQA